jgi:hypothetical protein
MPWIGDVPVRVERGPAEPTRRGACHEYLVAVILVARVEGGGVSVPSHV